MQSPTPAEDVFEHRGWTFTHASSARIAAAGELEALAAALALGSVPLPEMTFAANFLEVRHAASGFCVRFSAEDARRLGFETEVIEAACRSIDLDGSADAARKSFAEHGIALA
jgi:hypothetical protein